MTDPCPRCAELEARLASFEKETFAELRARVSELEEVLKGLLVQLRAHQFPHIRGLLEWAEKSLEKK